MSEGYTNIPNTSECGLDRDGRREFVQRLATLCGGAVLMPSVVACGGAGNLSSSQGLSAQQAAMAIPLSRPGNWDALEFNRNRGDAGAIPKSYLTDIHGAEGDQKHLGKHLPYIPSFSSETIPEGYFPIMWGDASKGYARHPNAVRSDDNGNEGHWYNWIRVRKATDATAEEMKSHYPNWPTLGEDASGAYAVFGGQDIEADGGRNTVYLAALPPDVKRGDTLRVWAHCLTHGEYVDFVEW